MIKKEKYGKNNTNSLKEVIVLFFYVLIVILFFILIILISRIRVDIQNIKISTEKHMNRNINDNFKIAISLCVFNKINILKTYITKDKIDKSHLKNRLKKIRIKKINFTEFDKNKIKTINKHKPEFKYINLVINIGMEDATLTSYSVALLSSIIGVLLRNTIEQSNNSRFIVNPIYANKNLLNLELNCIIEMKMIHIIYIIYILIKKRRDDKYVRTSNRRSYDYSYE